MVKDKGCLCREIQSERKLNMSWIAVLLLICSGAEYCTASTCQTIEGTTFSTGISTKTKFLLSLQGCNTVELKNQKPGSFEARQLNLYDEETTRLNDLAAYSATAKNSLPDRPFSHNIQMVAESYDIDPLLLHAIAQVESRYNPWAVSHAGALGLMQVMPATAKRFGVMDPELELRDPLTNLKVSSAYLKTLQSMFGNNLHLVLAAYNAGEGAVIKYGRNIPPYRETEDYVRKVIERYLELKQFN